MTCNLTINVSLKLCLAIRGMGLPEILINEHFASWAQEKQYELDHRSKD